MDSYILVTLCLVGFGSSARLDNTYLPPGGGYSGATGSGSFSGGGGGGAYQPSGPVIPILSYENNPNYGDGSYSYSYSTQNGISAGESGSNAGGESGTAASGSFSYTGPDGQQYSITYTADANGFQPQGAHLPTPPPIPDAILKSLQYNAANPQSEYQNGGGADGSYSGGGGYQAPRPQYIPPVSQHRPTYGAPHTPGYQPSSGGYRY